MRDEYLTLQVQIQGLPRREHQFDQEAEHLEQNPDHNDVEGAPQNLKGEFCHLTLQRYHDTDPDPKCRFFYYRCHPVSKDGSGPANP